MRLAAIRESDRIAEPTPARDRVSMKAVGARLREAFRRRGHRAERCKRSATALLKLDRLAPVLPKRARPLQWMPHVCEHDPRCILGATPRARTVQGIGAEDRSGRPDRSKPRMPALGAC